MTSRPDPDEPPRSTGRTSALSILDEGRAAVGLLTILPVGRRELPAEAAPGAAIWFPLVGGIVGVAAAGAYALAEALLGGFYGAAFALLVAAILSGALHHDGLADLADGLGAGGDRAHRLAVMRDSAIGTYGTLALLAYALLATAALTQLEPPDAAAAIVCGHVLGRWAALVQLAYVPPARADGLGAAFSATISALAIGSIVSVAIAIAAVGVGAGLSAVAGAAIAAAAMALAARRLVGGRTGDTLGAAVLVSELTVLSVLAAYLPT